jgi:ABC-type transport system involved in cytochrome bd biosynthesis fused ATPase/permease subunit
MPALASSSAQLLAFPGPGIGLRAALLAQLKLHRLPEHLIEAFIREAVSLPVCGIDEALNEVLAARMLTAAIDPGRRIFLIGPSGAGVASVAEKLRHHAELNDRSIQVESQNFHPRNMRARTAFGCVSQRPDVETIGVVSALADAEEISEIISAFRLSRIIVTGLDMARRFGALAAAVTQGARLVAVTRSAKIEAPLEPLSARELAGMLLR